MQKSTIIAGVVALIFGVIGGYGLGMTRQNSEVVKGGEASTEVAPAGMHHMSDGSLMENADTSMSATNGADHMMNMMVQSEKDFIEGMIPHHQEAIDTASIVLAKGGTTPEIRQLAENIVTAQTREINEMKAWYETWFGVPYQDIGEYAPMMRDLTNLSGVELDRVFLTDMVMHHMGAIMMAQSVKPYLEHDEMRTLTDAVVTTQSAEITAMEQYLEKL